MNIHPLVKEEKERKRVDLQLIKGGKEPPSGNWLQDLEVGTVFLVTDKVDRTFSLGEYHLMFKTDTACKLLCNLNAAQTYWAWVEPRRFCNRFDLVEVLGHYDIPKPEEETTD
jgi:hypothetical protein